MATMLDTPEAAPLITQQGITRVELRFPHKRNAGNTAEVVDKQHVEIVYDVTTWDAAGKVARRKSRTVPLSSWPNVLKQDVRSLYDKLAIDARHNGLLGAGTDEAL